MSAVESVVLRNEVCPTCAGPAVWHGTKIASTEGTNYRIDCAACTAADQSKALAIVGEGA